jgi:hypothetical protein
MWRAAALLLCLLFIAPAANAAAGPGLTDPWQPINPNGATITLAVTTTSASLPLAKSPIATASPAPQAWVCNIGTVNAYVAFSADPTKPLLATVARGFPVKAGLCSLLYSYKQIFVAAITASGSTTLTITSGSGNPIVPLVSDVGPWVPVFGNGSTATITATATTSAVPLSTPNASEVYLCNLGNVPGYVMLADVANHAIATVASGFPAQAGQCYLLNSLNMPYLAAITASGTTTITAASGSGSPLSPLGIIAGTGTLTSLTATLPIVITPSPTITVGDVSMANSGVTPGPYTCPTVTFEAHGLATAAANGVCLTSAVTSVTFTGDGVVDSSTPSAAVTTTGTLLATIKTQAAHTALMGPTGGGNVAPTFRIPVCADLSDAGLGCPAGLATISTAGVVKLNNVGYPAGWVATINPNNAVVTTVNQASTISAIIGRVETAAGGAATVQVNKAASGVACSAGTNLATGTFDANGTAATNQTLTLVGGATDNLAVGDSICFQTTGTTSWTGGTAIGTITVFFAPS